MERESHGPLTLSFRRLSRDDFRLLTIWLTTPQVARWWNHGTTPSAIESDFGPSVDGADPSEMFIALADRRPVGLIQRYRYLDNPEYIVEVETVVPVPPAALSIDYFIGEPDLLGRGMGSAMIAAFVSATWHDCPAASAIIVPVHAANHASWKALQRAGFRRVGEGPLEPDNPIDDRSHYIYRVDRPLVAGTPQSHEDR